MRQHGVEVDPLDQAADVDAVDERLDVDTGHQPVDVDPVEQAVDVDAPEQRVDVDPLQQGIDVDGVDDGGDHLLDDAVEHVLREGGAVVTSSEDGCGEGRHQRGRRQRQPDQAFLRCVLQWSPARVGG